MLKKRNKKTNRAFKASKLFKVFVFVCELLTPALILVACYLFLQLV